MSVSPSQKDVFPPRILGSDKARYDLCCAQVIDENTKTTERIRKQKMEPWNESQWNFVLKELSLGENLIFQGKERRIQAAGLLFYACVANNYITGGTLYAAHKQNNGEYFVRQLNGYKHGLGNIIKKYHLFSDEPLFAIDCDLLHMAEGATIEQRALLADRLVNYVSYVINGRLPTEK